MIGLFSSYQDSLNEGFRNLVLEPSLEARKVWLDRVWDILVKSYASIGGMKGSGFGSKEELLSKIPFWKLYTRGEKVMVAAFYKDSSGRKSVAYATDGSVEAKRILAGLFQSEVGVSYGEKSKGALIMAMRKIPFETLKPFLLTPAQAKILTGKSDVRPVTPEVLETLGENDKRVFELLKEKLLPYFYVRNISGEPFLKVAFGTPSIPIT
jgi:hypothetical protein